MNLNLWILLALILGVAGAAFIKSPQLPFRGLQASGRLINSVWLEMLLGFLMAGLLDVLISSETLIRWLGTADTPKGILIGWVVGLVMPGGPYIFFPVAAGLLNKGVNPGVLMTLLTAKTLVSPIRALTYEAPLLGWPMTLARLLPGILAPPLLGLAGNFVFQLLKNRQPPLP